MPSRLSHPEIAQAAIERLRREQFTIMSRRVGVTSAASLATCALVVRTFWASASHAYLLALLTALIVLHSLCMFGAWRWLSGEQGGTSRQRLHIRIAASAAIAIAWATVPTVLVPLATPDQRQLLITIGTGLMLSSIVLAPLLRAAVLFLAITTLGLLVAIPLAQESTALQHAALILVYAMLTGGMVIIQNRDLVRRVLNEAKIEEQSELIGLLLRDFEECASDFLWETDCELRLQRVSGRLAQIMGCAPNTLHGTSMTHWIIRSGAAALSEENAAAGLLASLADRRPFRDQQISLSLGNTRRWVALSGKPVLDAAGIFQGFRGVGSDVTAARRSDERITYLARYDSLTGLPNRMRFQDALSEACGGDALFALHCLDLDGFKAVNDTLGHAAGDSLLVAVAGRLRACLRDGDVAARLGGDEFAVLQVGASPEGAAALAQRLIERIGEPYQLGELSASVGVSVGIALQGEGRRGAEDLLRGADLALYHSKSKGRGVWHVFEAAMAVRAQTRHRLLAELRHAIAHGELVLDFQPICDLATGAIIGAEALVRWLHPVRGRIPPAEFIPAAEESGLIVALGEWVLRRACNEAATWASTARVAVNLSPVQFRDPGLLPLVDQVLAETGLPAQRLELEITESVFLDAQETTVACLNALRARGIHIALDDFGTGYSSLSYLRSFPFDRVKIDRSFIRDLGVNDEAAAIVHAIVDMASSLGMRTTGEGVETQSQADLLARTGCGQVQGYLFGRPCAPEAIGSVMRADAPPFGRPALETLVLNES